VTRAPTAVLGVPMQDKFECPACGQWRDLKTAVRFSDTLICDRCETEEYFEQSDAALADKGEEQ